MPQYEYRCESCNQQFTVSLSMSDHEEKDREHEIRCPECDSHDVKHIIELVNVVTSRKS
ncbi:MAG TPA: zinc ribbon domain-containing protein [Opitutaceae bacterium]